ncbi:MAG: hypothetical protein EZS28_028771 [Streblomastix strix]|uniref:Uncharacterized protein n=1 Tax=Streblomastix strix TaxID=222440 RepID=A0A5J4V0W6_9EUKA|nr:MAG: hypothetical protein EZS28_028771 [Streblomastix strix]
MNDVGATFERRKQGQKNDVDLRHTAPLGKTLPVPVIVKRDLLNDDVKIDYFEQSSTESYPSDQIIMCPFSNVVDII